MKYALFLLSIGAMDCPGGGGGAFQQDFTDACTAATNLGQALCDCMAQKAEDELTEDERAFVLASLEEDESQTAKLRGELGLDGAIRAGMFMTEVSSCLPDQVNP